MPLPKKAFRSIVVRALRAWLAVIMFLLTMIYPPASHSLSHTSADTASASRTFTRALRSAPTTQAFRTTASRRPAQLFQQQARRGYSSSTSSSSSSTTWIWGAAAGGIALGAGGYLAFREKGSSETKTQTASTPSKEDYQNVYDAIAQRLIDEDDYDNDSYGPVVLRLGWHASGTYDAEAGTGGSNGATMRFDPEAEHGAMV
ncbi:hypothetical protein AC579_4163 [Pseudocercospora musae]|uniref:Uncharacterized protein n=1 Tax=Pseudocercospora musae TaxID=113226 RepID=A0A139IG05_9PEZI|nr:hypothetical protein AC579_4163 [Pseudocercospora musae]